MFIVGNQKIQNFLNKAIEKRLIAQAYIFSGPESVGKFTLAWDFAKKITREEKTALSADILVVRPEIEEKKNIIRKKDISIDQIREAQNWLSLTSQGDSGRVVIVDEGERMKKGAQNALLKTLEDTPEKAVLIIVTKHLEALLPTIISRSQTKKFSLVSEREMAKMIPDENRQKEDFIFWSMGRPGRVKKFLEEENLLAEAKENQKEILRLMDSSVFEKLEKAESLAKNKELFLEKATQWVLVLRQAFLGERNSISIDRKRAFLAAEAIGKSAETIQETNANSRLVLENLFLNF